MEGFFDFKDFIVRILKRWRLIVVVAVIFTIALGGIKYVTGISNIGTETSEENDNNSTQSEIKNIKKSKKYIDKYDAECYYITIKERKKSPKDI